MTFRGLASLSAFPLLLVAVVVACNKPCVTLPRHTGSDLACDSDNDCTATWSGTVCCGCHCGNAPANTAAQARDQATLSSALNDCTQPTCGCPAFYVARCFAHQCTLCGTALSGPFPGQPAACDEADGGARDAAAGD